MRRTWAALAVVGITTLALFAARERPAEAPAPAPAVGPVQTAPDPCGAKVTTGPAIGVYRARLPGGGSIELHAHRSKGVSVKRGALTGTDAVAWAKIDLGAIRELFDLSAQEAPRTSVLCGITSDRADTPLAGVVVDDGPAGRVLSLEVMAKLDPVEAAALFDAAPLRLATWTDQGARPDGRAWASVRLGDVAADGAQAVLTPDGRITGPITLTLANPQGKGISRTLTLK